MGFPSSFLLSLHFYYLCLHHERKLDVLYVYSGIQEDRYVYLSLYKGIDILVDGCQSALKLLMYFKWVWKALQETQHIFEVLQHTIATDNSCSCCKGSLRTWPLLPSFSSSASFPSSLPMPFSAIDWLISNYSSKKKSSKMEKSEWKGQQIGWQFDVYICFCGLPYNSPSMQ